MTLGATPLAGFETAACMVLTEEPPAARGADIRTLDTLEEAEQEADVTADAFGWPDEHREAMRTMMRRFWAQRDPARRQTFGAYLDGRLVAVGIASFTPHGVYLDGGATLPVARGKGLYTALVRARWDEAVRRGTPALAVQAGEMSRPILERLGFPHGLRGARSRGRFRVIAPELAEFAESPSAFEPWEGGFERTLNERYCLVAGPHPHFVEISRVRLRPEEVETTVEEIRARLRASGHRDPVWWLGSSATPPDLAERLLALGFRDPRDRADRLVALATREPPEPGPAGVEVRRAESLEDFSAALRVMWQAFDTPPEQRWDVEQAYGVAQGSPSVVNFLALLEGRPVAAGRAAFCDRGGLLFGGSTLPEARGRGAYRALVRARWDEAVRRGTPALVTQAAPTSEPILRRLGFEEVCRIRRLEDPI